MPTNNSSTIQTRVNPNDSETSAVEKQASSVINEEIKAMDKTNAQPASENNSPEATAGIKYTRVPDRPAPRQVMRAQGARGTNARVAARGNSRRRQGYHDASVPRVEQEQRYATNDFSYAYFKQSCFFFSDAAQMFFERNYQRTDRALLIISLVCGAIGGDGVARRKVTEVEECGKNIEQQLMNAIDEFKRLMTQQNIPEELQVPSYDHKRQYSPALHTPQSLQFMTIVTLFDRIVSRIDACWFHKLIPFAKRREMISAWTKELNRYAQAVQQLRNSALEEARNAGRKQEAKQIEQIVENDKSNDTLGAKNVAVEETASASGEKVAVPKDEAPVVEEPAKQEEAKAEEPAPVKEEGSAEASVLTEQIESLGLSAAACKRLRAANIETVGDLVKCTKEYLTDEKLLGAKALSDLEATLTEKGLALSAINA